MNDEPRNGQEREAQQRVCDLRHRSLEERIDDLDKLCETRWLTEEKAMYARWANLEQRFRDNDERLREAKVTADKAVDKAEKLATTRAEQQNEWRSTVNDIMGTMLTRDAYDRNHGLLADRIHDMSERVLKFETRQAASTRTFAWIVAGAGAFVAAASLFIDMVLRH